MDLSEVLQDRQTRRHFGRALTMSELGKLLWFTCRTHSRVASAFGFDQQFRAHPSAGAVHPIHVLLQLSPASPWGRYDTLEHALVEIPGTLGMADQARNSASQLVHGGDAALLLLVGEPGKTAAKYESPESLVWRDAGIVLGYLSLVSEMLGLSFCPLGLTGDAYVAPISEPGLLRGGGLAWLGSR